MLVIERMTRPPITITDDTSVGQALKIIEEHKLRHLPVLDAEGSLVGIVSEKDLLRASGQDPVESIMTSQVITVTEYTALEDAARIMADHKISSLPVMRDGKLVGIITETDLFNIFTEQLGARSMGVRLTLQIDDVKGALATLTGRITELGGNIVRLTTLPGKEKGKAIVTVKIEGKDEEVLVEGLSEIGAQVLDTREGRGWAGPGFSPYHWVLEG
jgi:acetoin utilization protein AcuB